MTGQTKAEKLTGFGGHIGAFDSLRDAQMEPRRYRRVRFALCFANADIASWGDREHVSFRRYLWEYLSFSDVGDPDGLARPATLTRAAIGRLHVETRRIILGWLGEGVCFGRVSGDLTFQVERRAGGASGIKRVHGRVEPVYTMLLLLALGSDAGSRLRVCPGCQLPFFRVGKMTSCSRRCQMRAYMRQQRADERLSRPDTTQRRRRVAQK